MKKIIFLLSIISLTIGIFQPALAIDDREKIKEYSEKLSQKYADTNPEINKFFEDIDYSLKKKLIEREVLRPEIIDALPKSDPLTRQQFYTLYLEFEIGDKKLSQPTEDPYDDISTDHEFAKQAAYIRSRDLYRTRFGNFFPDQVMTVDEMKTTFSGVEDIYIADEDTPLTLSVALNYLYRYFEIQLETESKFTSPSNITLDNKYFYNNDKKIQGLFVHWHTADVGYSDKDIREELRKMKKFGVIGVSTEIPWRSIETSSQKYEIPRIPDSIAKVAQEEGMWVTFLLSPHYIPDLVFDDFNPEVKLHNEKGEAIDRSGFINFSIYSPVVDRQIKFQQEVIKHFNQYDNVLAYYLSNEPGYDQDFLGDYSFHALEAWDKWCTKMNLKSCDVPRKKDHPNYQNWMIFQQQGLIDYMNKTYREVKKSLTKFVPLSHKTVPYFLPNELVANVGLEITPASIEWDFIAADTYGFTPHVYDHLKGFQKPIMIAETNLIKGWDRNDFYRFLVYQYLNGASIQTIYKWEYSLDSFSLFAPSGKLSENAHALIKAIYAIEDLKDTLTFKENNIGLILPRNLLSQKTEEIHQKLNDFTLSKLDNKSETPRLIWSNDLSPIKYLRSHSTNPDILKGLEKIYLLTTQKEDIAQDLAALENTVLWEWIANGGQLVLPEYLAPNKVKEIKYQNGIIFFCNITDC